MNCVLGIDTSCYTTSVAIMSIDGDLLADERKILSVKEGTRGLAQSEMVFQHTRNLPVLFQQALSKIETPVHVAVVGVSAYPRPLPDSYMPVFLVGEGYAKVIATLMNSKLHRISHQENHIFAGVWSAKGPMKKDFLAVHVSGGTTEIVRIGFDNDGDMTISLLGGTSDLHAGQFIDRIGVALQLPFPAGTHMETLAKSNFTNMLSVPVSVTNTHISFSGPETHVLRSLEKNYEPASIAAGVQHCIAVSIFKMIAAAISQTGIYDVLLVGGVMSNEYIRHYICDQFSKADSVKLFMPLPEYSPDNSVGAAYSAFCAYNSTSL